jgi:hypothetical protein
MEHVIEVNEDGSISLPAEVVGDVAPRTRFVVERQNGKLILEPESASAFWEKLTPAERAADFRQWIASIRQREPAHPPLPDEALRRESMYD